MAPKALLRLLLLPVLLASHLRLGAATLTNRLEQGHVDIRVRWNAAAAATNSPEALDVVFHVDDLGGSVSPTNHAVRIPESARLEIPPGFELFGDAGSSIWILPQSLAPGLVYLGLSTEGLPREVFTGEIELRLLGFRGAGHFFLWQSDALGSLDVRMDSRDGISAADRAGLSAGGHAHYNFGFTSNGVHEVSFQVVARIAGRTEPYLGVTNRLQFQVEPLPAVVPTPWERWVVEHFGNVPDPGRSDPGADPDLDGLPNLHEFLAGTSPVDASSREPLRIVRSPGDGALELRMAVAPGRPDSVDVVVEQASSPTGPWSDAGTPTFPTDGVAFSFPIPDPAVVGRYHRLRLQLR